MNKVRIPKPNYTEVPNAIFDVMNEMEKSELKVVLAICRKTSGWHKDRDRIAFSQLSEMTGLNNSGVQRGIESAIERGVVLKNPVGNSFEYEIAIYEEYASTTTVPESVPPQYRKSEKSVPPRYVQKKDIKKKDIPQSEKISPPSTAGELEFAEPTPRERISPERAIELTAEALQVFEATGGKPEVADPRAAHVKQAEHYAAEFAAILSYADFQPRELSTAANQLLKADWYQPNKKQIDKRLADYRNGDGKSFRKPGQTVWFILSQLQRDIASGKGKRKPLEISE